MDTSIVLGELAAVGVNAWPESSDSFATEDGRHIFVSSRSRTPTPVDIKRDLARAEGNPVLYSVPRLTPGLQGAVKREKRLIVYVSDTHSLWFAGSEHRPDARPVPKPAKGPKPYNRFALTRALLLDRRTRRQVDLAEEIGAPQSAVSQSLRSLNAALLDDSGAHEPQRLWDRFLAEYPGAGGITTYWWHDSRLDEQARLVTDTTAALVSGDLAARAIAPWRQPEHATLYLAEGLDPTALGFALGTPDDYTLSVTVPDDRTIFATAKAFSPGAGLVDPVMAAYDVARTGTTGDQGEAVERIRDVVLGTGNPAWKRLL